MLIGELFAQNLHAGVFGNLHGKAGGVKVQHRALPRGHVRHALRDIHIVAEQAVAPFGGGILVQQVVALTILQLADGGAGRAAHHPDAAGLQLVGDALLQVDQFVGGDGGSSSGRHGGSDLGHALDLAVRTVDQLVLKPLGHSLGHLADDIGHDVELAVVDQGHGDLGQSTGQETAQRDAGELARAGSQRRELGGVSHRDLLGGFVIAGDGQGAAHVVMGREVVQGRDLLDHLDDLVGDGGRNDCAIVPDGHVGCRTGLHIGGDTADIALKGAGFQLLLGTGLLLAAGGAAFHLLQSGALVSSVQSGVNGTNLGQDFVVLGLLLLIEGAGFGLAVLHHVFQLSHQLDTAFGQLFQVERHNHILLLIL